MEFDYTKTPIYQHSVSYAAEHGELDAYRASQQTNIACRDAIDAAIADNYRNNCLGRDAVKQVVDVFGYDRTLYVLANTVQQKEWDGRFSRQNKAWAQMATVFENKDTWGHDHNREFIVDRAHPGLTDLFTTQARHDYLLTLPLTREDIQYEAARLLEKLQEPKEPNSPNGTHFMAQISPDFLMRAGTEDQDKLFALLPFSSLTISSLNDHKGEFAFIAKEENRNQPLRKRSSPRKARSQPTLSGKLDAAKAQARQENGVRKSAVKSRAEIDK